MDDPNYSARIDDSGARRHTASADETAMVDALVVQNCECLRS